MTRIMSHKLDKFEFGKHKGKTVREVIDKDPGYILWLDEEKIVEFPDQIIELAADSVLDQDQYMNPSWYDGQWDDD